jgi:dTDP-4-dehydrorhamnose 3,5-epimerase
MTTAFPGVVKGWHYHKVQYDNMIVVKGMMKIVLFDSRKDSPTYKEVNEFFLGDYNPQLLHIPPLVFHGFKCVSESEALVINIPTEAYNYSRPDEYRVPPHDNDILYDWNRKDG